MPATDTIAAIATPPGVGGIGIVRLSGPAADRVAARVVGKLPEPRRAGVATFRNKAGDRIDAGLVLFFPAPHSFTGETVVELHGHGGPVVMHMLLEAVIEAGARRAEPGEFSRRAFENDKLDLAQAEAVADLIASGSERAARTAMRSLSGEFSLRVHELIEVLTQIRIYVEAAIDFPDEEIDFLSDSALKGRLDRCREQFDDMLAKAETGRLLRDGFQVVIAGRPNAGKSSLMNRLSGDETAIVTDIAGTTRDVLRETIVIHGVVVELVDTAGLRENPGSIEREGIRRAQAAMTAADAVLWVVDSNDEDDAAGESEAPPGTPVLVVHNKIDLVTRVSGRSDDGSVCVSAVRGDGIDDLKAALLELAGLDEGVEGAFSARARHVDAIRSAARHFEEGVRQLTEQRAGELLAEELRLAQSDLGEITGAVHSDDLLGRIFSDFCIGK